MVSIQLPPPPSPILSPSSGSQYALPGKYFAKSIPRSPHWHMDNFSAAVLLGYPSPASLVPPGGRSEEEQCRAGLGEAGKLAVRQEVGHHPFGQEESFGE